jgi:hypothetical protein
MCEFKKTAGVLIAFASVAIGASGCQTSGTGARRITSTEPGLNAQGETIVEGTPPSGTAVTWVDRHPLFSKPKQYYDNSGSSNKVARVVSATVIGVPVGLFGELKQIVVGTPNQPRQVDMRVETPDRP